MIRTRRILFFSASDIWFDTAEFISSKKSISILHTNKVIEQESYSLCLRGKTLVIDLHQPVEKIFAALDPKSARYPIRKAERDGVSVKIVENENEKEEFITFFKTFSDSKGIPNINKDDLREQDVFCAYSAENILIGGATFIKSNDLSVYRYKHGATNYTSNANDLLLWNAIKHAKQKGHTIFDFGGVKVTDDKSSYYYRHYKFKEKFGGELSDFYTYVKFKKPLSYLMLFPDLIVKWFFKNDYTSFINTLSKIKILR